MTGPVTYVQLRRQTEERKESAGQRQPGGIADPRRIQTDGSLRGGGAQRVRRDARHPRPGHTALRRHPRLQTWNVIQCSRNPFAVRHLPISVQLVMLIR